MDKAHFCHNNDKFFQQNCLFFLFFFFVSIFVSRLLFENFVLFSSRSCFLTLLKTRNECFSCLSCCRLRIKKYLQKKEKTEMSNKKCSKELVWLLKIWPGSVKWYKVAVDSSGHNVPPVSTVDLAFRTESINFNHCGNTISSIMDGPFNSK